MSSFMADRPTLKDGEQDSRSWTWTHSNRSGWETPGLIHCAGHKAPLQNYLKLALVPNFLCRREWLLFCIFIYLNDIGLFWWKLRVQTRYVC